MEYFNICTNPILLDISQHIIDLYTPSPFNSEQEKYDWVVEKLLTFKYVYKTLKGGLKLNPASPTVAASHDGHLKILQYLIRVGFKIHPQLAIVAVKENQYETLKYLVEHGCHYDSHIITYAAVYNRKDCLEYLHNHGCPWNSSTVGKAVEKYSDLELIRYVIENGCPYPKDRICEAVATTGNLKLLKYFVEEEKAAMSIWAFYNAVSEGHYHLIEYMDDQFLKDSWLRDEYLEFKKENNLAAMVLKYEYTKCLDVLKRLNFKLTSEVARATFV